MVPPCSRTVAEHYSQHMRSVFLAVRIDERRASTKVDLCFLARCRLHQPKGKLGTLAKSFHIPVHAPVAATKTVVDNQILVDPLRSKLLLEASHDGFVVFGTSTAGRRCRCTVCGRFLRRLSFG